MSTQHPLHLVALSRRASSVSGATSLRRSKPVGSNRRSSRLLIVNPWLGVGLAPNLVLSGRPPRKCSCFRADRRQFASCACRGGSCFRAHCLTVDPCRASVISHTCLDPAGGSSSPDTVANRPVLFADVGLAHVAQLREARIAGRKKVDDHLPNDHCVLLTNISVVYPSDAVEHLDDLDGKSVHNLG